MKSYKKYIIFLAGIFILTMGVTIMLKSDLGTGSWDAINFGFKQTFGMSVGIWVNISSLTALIIAAIINKEFPKIVSFITAFLIGINLDFWYAVFDGILINNIISRFLIFFLGILISCIGIAIYLLPNLPQNPIDYLMITIKNKFNLKLMQAKILIDVLCIFGALLLHGPIGIGTIFATILVGPVVNFFYDRFLNYYKSCCQDI